MRLFVMCVCVQNYPIHLSISIPPIWPGVIVAGAGAGAGVGAAGAVGGVTPMVITLGTGAEMEAGVCGSALASAFEVSRIWSLCLTPKAISLWHHFSTVQPI